MFEVIIKNTAEVSLQMADQVYQFKNDIYELDGIISTIQSLKGLGDLGRPLRKIKDNMQTQSEILRYMGNALGKVVMNYTRSEERIIDECENTSVRYSWRETGVINIALPDSALLR